MDDFMNERTLIYTKFEHDEVIILLTSIKI